MKPSIFTLILFFLFGITACSKNSASPDPVSAQSAKTILYWNEIAFEAFGGVAYQHSLMASRINTMMHLAMHDALNGIEEKYERYAFKGNDKKADPIAAASAAAHAILLQEIPGRQGFLDSALATALNYIQDENSRLRGIELGKNAALAILDKRLNDNSSGKELLVPVPSSTDAGVYQATPPFNIFFAPHWEHVKLFSLENKSQFRVPPQPALNSAVYQKDFEEVKQAGSKNSATRSPDQTSYSKFWYEFSESGWNRITREVVKAKDMNMLDAARLFALVDMALADAYIAGWDSKIYYNFWRPYTAIRNAASDGNDATTVDPQWEPSMPTPPVPDYPSTHSALGNAASTVLATILGNQMSFSFTSPTGDPGTNTRAFQSFSQASDENADSRVRAGIHFRFSCEAGQTLGNKIGKWTVENHLKLLQ